MSNEKRVVLVGWNPDVVDYSKWPDMNAEKVRGSLESNHEQLNALGYNTELLFIDDAESAAKVVENALQGQRVDCVLIGAGVRLDPASLLVFEQLINTVHKLAPLTKICFNTNPQDIAEAVRRWI